MATITMAELAYTAGIVDGEGCISIQKRRSTVHAGGYQYIPKVVVVNTALPVIDWLKDRFGGSVSVHQHGTARWKKSWTWQLSNRDVASFVSAIKPFLVIKRKQADAIIAFPKTAKFGRTHVTPEILAQRIAISGQMATMNKRGA